MNASVWMGRVIWPWLVVLPAWAAAPAPAAEPVNLVSLSASASAEVVQDWVSVTVGVQREGSEAGAVQQQLSRVLAPALQAARAQAQPAELEVATGVFQVLPRYGQEGRLASWLGRAELVLSGRDLARVSALATRLEGMTVSQVRWSLSAAPRQRTEDEVQAQAVQRFRARAQALAAQFGFSSHQLREVQVGASEAGMPVQPLMARASAVPAAPLPLEAARTTVSVTVSGTVQLKP